MDNVLEGTICQQNLAYVASPHCIEKRSANMLSKNFTPIYIILGLVMTASLAGCATPSGDQDQDQDHGQHHPGQSASTSAPDSSGGASAQGGMAGSAMTGSQAGCGMMGGSATGSQAGCGMMGGSKAAGGVNPMDKEAMCAMYRNMRDAPTEQARQAMMDRNMQGMSSETRQQHMEMMRQQCQ
jgi:hypothetical protein